MRLSVITDEISMDLAYAIDVMKEYDCTGVELRSIGGTNISNISDAQADEIKKIVTEKGMEVVALASPLFKCELGGGIAEGTGRLHEATQRTVDEQMDVLVRCGKYAKMLGTKYIRTFAFWRRGEQTPQIEDAVAAGMADAIKYAEDNDLVLLLENEHDCYMGTGAETARFLSRFNSPALRACWDPGNAYFAGEIPFPDGYNAIRNYISHVHIKDAELLASGKYRFIVVGDGEIDFKGQLAALKADGYEGYLSIETHYRPFGGTPEQGSRLSLQGLKKLLSE